MADRDDFDFIPGKGEMARLIREKDWSQTSIGHPNSWPNSLKTLLCVILHSKFPMFIWWGPELISFYNDAYRPSLGNQGKHPSILGQPAESAWVETWPVIQPLIQQVMAGGEATWSEDQLIPIYRNGTMEDVYWTFSYSRINNDNGDGYGVLVTCVETTQKVRNQKRLEEAAELLKFSTEAAELGTWDYNPATNKFTANNRLKTWFGLAANDEIDLHVAISVMAAKDRERVSAAIAAAIDPKHPKPYDIQYSIINPETGDERIVLARGKAYFTDQQKAYRFSGTMEDVTQQVAARRILEEAEERARLAIAAGNMGTFDFDIRNRKAITSDRFLEIFGTEAGVDHQALVDCIHPEDLPIRNKAIATTLETGSLHYEVRLAHKDNSIGWVRVDGKVVAGADGDPARMLGIAMDITAYKEFELKREEYIAIASHELKNPMTSLKLSLDMLASIVKSPENILLVEKSREQVKKLISLTNELLNVSKISAGVLEINPEIFNLESAIRESIATIETGSPDVFQITGTPDLSIFADQFRIEQVLVNLLSNAVKYSPKNTPIQIEVTREEGHVRVSVRDKGIGIDAMYLPKIFHKFSRLDAGRSIEGHGLGLYISDQIIHRHGGDMGVESEKGKGSTFWFKLPQ